MHAHVARPLTIVRAAGFMPSMESRPPRQNPRVALIYVNERRLDVPHHRRYLTQIYGKWCHTHVRTHVRTTAVENSTSPEERYVVDISSDRLSLHLKI
jgi:hypothetical protein